VTLDDLRASGPVPAHILEALDKVRYDIRRSKAITNDVYDRACAFAQVLPSDFPTPIVRALANGSVMFYWSKANIPGYHHHEKLELRVEITPSLCILYDWTVIPGVTAVTRASGKGGGIVRASSHAVRVLTSPARAAFMAFAPFDYIVPWIE
jgi:hypothetical protein